MKLNNKGFGLKELIIMSAALLFILILLAYFIYSLYNELTPKSSYEYMKNELKLKVAAQNYVKKNKPSGSKILTYKFLKDNGYVGDLSKGCSGYVLYINKEFNPYIICDGYITEGYDKNIS